MLAKYVESLSKHYYKVRWNCYKIATALYISKSDGQLLQIATAFLLQLCETVYYKLRQVFQSAMIITNCDSTRPYSLWSKGGAVVRALASHQCDPGSNPGVDAMCYGAPFVKKNDLA